MGSLISFKQKKKMATKSIATKKKRKKKSEKTKLRDKADKLWRSVGKENAECEVCATLPHEERVNYTQLHPHHLVRRGLAITRWDLRNRLWVCPTHHTMGKKTAEYNEEGWFWSEGGWMDKHRPEDKKYLAKLKPITKRWTLTELREIVSRLGG